MMKRLLILLALYTHCPFGITADITEHTFRQWVDNTGEITLPAGYRRQWAHIGSWTVKDQTAPGYGFHDVYTQPEAIDYYLKTGRFADGTVVVKEVRAIHEGIKTTGKAQWAGAVNVWFVMIKDRTGRFNNNPHWSNGWGWALFEASAAKPDGSVENTSKGFAQSCQGCHTPAQSTDWIFLEGYPTLIEH